MKKSSIRKKLLLSMIGLLSVLLLFVTAFEIKSENEHFQEELNRRIKLMRKSMNERGKALSSQIAVYAENAIASYNFFNISQIMEDMVKENESLEYGILSDNSGMIHVHTKDSNLVETRLDSESDKFILQQTEFTVQKAEKNGVSYLEFISPVSIGNNRWGFLRLGFSLVDLNAEIEDSRLSTKQYLKDEISKVVGIYLLCAALGSLLIINIAKRITDPLQQLTKFSSRLAEGNFNAKVPKEAQKANDETGVLSRAFVDMVAKLGESRAKLEDYSKSLEREIAERKRSDAMISNIARGVSSETGDAFFISLVQYLANTLDMTYVFIGKLVGPENKKIKTIALYANGKVVDNEEYDLANAPCENVFKEEMRCYPSGVQDTFPLDYLLKEMGVESYCGITLCDSAGKVLGIMAGMDSKPIKNQKIVESLIKIFAVRAAAELERLQSEEASNYKTKLIQLLQEITITANETSTIVEAMQVCLDKICLHTGWPVGHVYETDSGGVRLNPTKTWCLDGSPQQFEIFREVTEATSFDIGVGLPGRILKSGKPLWIEDVTKTLWFLRAKSAKDANVKSGFGFPVLEGKKVVAVLEFYSEKTTEPDKSILEAFSHLAVQLGRVTERKRAEEALRESHDRLYGIMDNSIAVICLKDVHGRYILINRRFETLFKVDKEKIIGKTDEKIFPLKIAKAFQYNDQLVIEKGSSIEFEEYMPHDDGMHTYISIKFPLFDSNREIYGICNISTDITERKKAETAQKQFSKKIVESQEQERKRIATELHDSLAQSMMVINNEAQRIIKKYSEKPKDLDSWKLISSVALESVNEIKEISYNLRPSELDQFGLKDAIQSLIEKISRTSGIEIRKKIDLKAGSISSVLEIQVYRIIQEGLNNVVKHSLASEAMVNIKSLNECMRIEISDDGSGFESHVNHENDAVTEGFGLRGIEERAKMFGGSLKIDSTVGRGTLLKVTIPMSNDKK